MRFRSGWAVAAALVTAVFATPCAAAPTGPQRVPHSVPPPAPSPTSSDRSPDSPDPHPPLGGRDPDGRPVGGAALLRRGLVLPSGAPRLPAHITARSWIVTDLDTGAVLAARDPHGRYQPASIQKLLTTVTLLPLLPGDRTVIVSKRAADVEGSHAGLVAGGRYTVDEVFRGLLLVSGNDAAEALADAAGGREHTVALMNATARRLGAYDTLVQTPSGLDGWQQLTSAYDMALVLRASLEQPRFRQYDTVARSYLPVQPRRHLGVIELDNQNELFLTQVKGALAAKTGFTDAAQHTFVGAIERGGHRYGVVLMRAQRWPIDQWQQATRLVTWATNLPAGTAPVGRLVTPAGVTPAGRVAAPSVVTPHTSPARATVPATPATPSPSSSSDRRPPLTGGQWIVLAVIVGAAVYLSARLRRRH